MATYTKWGYADSKTKYATGVNYYSTPSHGGFILSEGKNKQIPSYARRDDRAYEQDCDYAIVMTFFPGLFTTDDLVAAKASLRTWHPDIYERKYGEIIPEGESWVKDKLTFERNAIAGNWFVVRAAWGDWHEKLPAGFVGVVAEGMANRERKYFLVPSDEYETRGKYGFVIDTDKHAEWEDHA